MYQRQFQKIQPQTTAHLAQTMSLLYLNTDELNQAINKELNENPALITSEEKRCPKCNRLMQPGQACSFCLSTSQKEQQDSIIFLSPKEEFYPKSSSSDNEVYADDFLGQEEASLDEYVFRQIAADIQEDERIIAAYILNQLDEDGFFKESLYELSNYYHIGIEKVKRVKQVIQRADPVGVGSDSPEEAMLIQLRILKEIVKIPDYYLEIAENHLPDLLRKKYKEIAKMTSKSVEEIRSAADFFSKNLNPFPARAHWGTFRDPGKNDHLGYSFPDVIINNRNSEENKGFMVEVIIPGNSLLEINPFYNEAIKEADIGVKEKLKNDIEKANLFIKCLQQRNNTMQKLISQLVRLQKDFILNGEKFVKPLTRSEISKILEVHESTVSRAVSNKTAQLPDGRIIPLSTFFDRSLAIRTELKEIIQNEQKKKPYSDAKLATLLSKRGYKVARRTVAKYRAMEGILPAHQRKD